MKEAWTLEVILAINLKGHFPLGGIFRAERHFFLYKDQLAGSGRQKTKENINPRGKFHLVENSSQTAFPLLVEKPKPIFVEFNGPTVHAAMLYTRPCCTRGHVVHAAMLYAI